MEKSEPWYLRMRAEALAFLLLTDRQDVQIGTIEGQDTGLDFLVDLLDEGKSTRHFIGVQLKATAGSLQAVKPADLLSDAARDRRWVTLPICLFLFSVTENKGLYTWIAEPVISEEGQPKLQFIEHPQPQTLDHKAVDTIVERAKQWYEALRATLTGRKSV